MKTKIIVLGVPVLYALVLHRIFSLAILQSFIFVMSLTFLLSLPFGVGLLTITLSRVEKVKSRYYRIFMPWLPIGVFFITTLLLSLEGWACWAMIMPVFLLFASLGGLTAGHYKLKKYNSSNKLNISIALLLPILLQPIENIIKALPAKYEAYTFIDIQSSRSNIWSNVTRVRQIKEEDDKGTLTNTLSFPRPVKAELDYEGIGGRRKAIFTKGLVFDEVVKEYEPGKMMSFSIKANPYNIPSTTMDEHIVIGGDYFDVLNGTYELQQLNKTTYRLHLYSNYTLNTTFNFYASLWAGWIMKDIQNNILQVIKKRCENNNATE